MKPLPTHREGLFYIIVVPAAFFFRRFIHSGIIWKILSFSTCFNTLNLVTYTISLYVCLMLCSRGWVGRYKKHVDNVTVLHNILHIYVLRVQHTLADWRKKLSILRDWKMLFLRIYLSQLLRFYKKWKQIRNM